MHAMVINEHLLVQQQWDSLFEVATIEALKHIKRCSDGNLCTVVSCGLSSLSLLRLLPVLPAGLVDGTMLVDPPPLHAVSTEAGRRRILNRFLGDIWSAPPITGAAERASTGRPKRSRGRTAGTDSGDEAVPDPTTPSPVSLVQRLSQALRTGRVTTADLLGEGPPVGAAAVAEGLGPGSLRVVCTDLLLPRCAVGDPLKNDGESGGDLCASPARNEAPEARHSVDAAVETDALHMWGLLDTDSGAVAPEDTWGLAAVEELAALYGALPVVRLGAAGGTDSAEEEGSALLLPRLVSPEGLAEGVSDSGGGWSDTAVARHAALADTVARLVGDRSQSRKHRQLK